MTVRDAARHVMRALGMTTVFGNPGSTELPFLQGWPEDFDYVLGLQELSVVAMADGYAQATGSAALVNLHSAVGVGHAMGSIYTAYLNQTPLVITAGQQARELLPWRPFLGSPQATELPKPHVKWAIEPARAEDVPLAILQAYTIAMQAPRGPVIVSIPSDDWDRPAAAPMILPQHFDNTPPDAAIAEICAALADAQNPALILGPGVARDGARFRVITLAERLGATAYTAPMASRSVFDETHALFGGHLPAAPKPLFNILKPHDLILAIGAPVFAFHVPGDLETFAHLAPIYQIDDNPMTTASAHAAISMVCSPGLAIDALLNKATAKSRAQKLRQRPVVQPSVDLTAEQVFTELAPALKPNTALVEEAPSHKDAFRALVPNNLDTEYFAMSSGGLGFALPAAAGIAISGRFDRVIAVIGDGSAMYSTQALWTIAQRALPVTLIILNNGGYGAMRSFSRILNSGPVPGIDIDGLDFCSMAQSHGVAAASANTIEAFGSALSHAQNSNGPFLIEARVDHAVKDLYDLN